jgi:hypothetical protein
MTLAVIETRGRAYRLFQFFSMLILADQHGMRSGAACSQMGGLCRNSNPTLLSYLASKENHKIPVTSFSDGGLRVWRRLNVA